MIEKIRYQQLNDIAIKKTENIKLNEPISAKIIDLILYKDLIVPMYRDSFMEKTEFLVCYKGNDVTYAPFILAAIDEDLMNNYSINKDLSQINEYKEEDRNSLRTYKLASRIKAIICNPRTDKDIKKIKNLLRNYFNDTKTS